MSLHRNVLLAWLSSVGPGLWLYSDIQKVGKVNIGTVYLMSELKKEWSCASASPYMFSLSCIGTA